MVSKLRDALEAEGSYLLSETVRWRWQQIETQLEIAYYTASRLPDLAAVTSVRGIVQRGDAILVVKNVEGDQHIIPGGRIEAGETLLDTLVREISEETSWVVASPQLLGVMYYCHLAPRPDRYPYRYPEFLQVVYGVEAALFSPDRRLADDYETEARFVPVDNVLNLPIPNGQKAFLSQLRRG